MAKLTHQSIVASYKMIKIRPASTKDAQEIVGIKNTTWKDTYKNLIDPQYLNSLKKSKEVIKKWQNRIIKATENQNTHLWVACNSSNVIGFIWAGKARQPSVEDLDYEIYAFYILPEYQHQGIGKKLFVTFTDTIKDDFFLWMLKDNKSELVYKKLGCQKTDHINPIIIGNKQYQEIAFIYKI